jgi:hypothetical protein
LDDLTEGIRLQAQREMHKGVNHKRHCYCNGGPDSINHI